MIVTLSVRLAMVLKQIDCVTYKAYNDVCPVSNLLLNVDVGPFHFGQHLTLFGREAI